MTKCHPSGGNNWGDSGETGEALNELKAFDYEIRNAGRFQISAAELAQLEHNRKNYFGVVQSDPRYKGHIGAIPGSLGQIRN